MTKPAVSILSVLFFLSATTSAWSVPDGYYLLDYTKSSSFPELEEQYRAMGFDIRQNSIETYKGIVIDMENDTYLDPVELLSFSVDRKGEISCPTNPTVTGFYNKWSGEFHWEGYIGFHNQLKYSKSSGTIKKIGSASKAGMKNSVVYRLKDSGGNQLTASFQDGFLIMKNEQYEDSPYQGWPVLVEPDGSFVSSLELATEVITGQTDAPPLVQAVHNATITTEGVIHKDGHIEISFYSDYAMTQDSQEKPKESFSGRVLDNQEISSLNGNSYKDFKIYLRSEINKHQDNFTYPDWYLNPPQDETTLYASGCRTMDDRENALKTAEVIAVSVLANQIRVRIQSEVLETNQNGMELVQARIEETSREELNYTVRETVYDEDSRTAYVLVAMKKETR